jgi:hypothetical protein
MTLREKIVEEIKRIAEEGKPPTWKAFERKTGIDRSEWQGVHWPSWGDALTEAGVAPVKQRKSPLTREIRALSSVLTANYRSVSRSYVSLLTAAVVTNSVTSNPIGAARNPTGSTASVFGVSLELDKFIPISIIIMCLIAFNYCLSFNQAFRTSSFFLDLELAIFKDQPTVGGSKSSTPTNDLLHSLYVGTFFESSH